jgi:hypothetical protein
MTKKRIDAMKAEDDEPIYGTITTTIDDPGRLPALDAPAFPPQQPAPQAGSAPEPVEAMRIDGDILAQVGFPLKRIRHRFKKNMKAKKLIFINMELRNGNHLTLAVPISCEMFRFNKGRYVYDDSMRYWSLTYKEWMLDYHEDLALPLKRQVPVGLIRQALTMGKHIDEIIYSMNPSSLDEFMQNNVIKAAIQASSIQPLLKRIFAFVLVGAILSLVAVGLVLYDSGLLARFGVGG